MKKYQHTRAFSLLEISIVLIIIAALVAAVMVGRSMIMTSRLQTVITDVGNLTSAIGNFKQAYQSLPGDFAAATGQWGTDSSTCPSGGGSTGTCDGNGDGKIGGYCSSGSYSPTYAYETFRVWQHLNSSTLYSSSLTGITSASTIYTAVGKNVPQSSIEGGGFTPIWLDDPSLCSNFNGVLTSGGAHGNSLVLSGVISINSSAPYAFSVTPVLTPEQAYQIDSKMDDGTPGTGNVRSFGTATSGCTSTTVATTATYSVSTTSLKCAAIFLTNY